VHRGLKLAWFVVPVVLCVFFFHLPSGPWSAVNGPATALQAARYALLIFLLIALAAIGTSTVVPDPIMPSGAGTRRACPLYLDNLPVNAAMPIRC
jgi:hypothetical protein